MRVRVSLLDDCWIWTGATRNGYGAFSLTANADNNRAAYAHRWAYEHLIGPIPQGLDLDHLCRNPKCVNPFHLEPVTRRINLLRGNTIPARHSAVLVCPHGHPYTEANTIRVGKNKQWRQCRACKNAYTSEYAKRIRQNKQHHHG